MDSSRSVMQMSICILVIAESLGAIENFTNLLASHSSFEHNIFVAANVEQAITLANLAQFDVVITHLPAMEMGAFESIVQLKCALQAKPILVISDAEEHALIAQAIRRLSERTREEEKKRYMREKKKKRK